MHEMATLDNRSKDEENDEKHRTNDLETHEQITIYTQAKRVMQIQKLRYKQGKFMQRRISQYDYTEMSLS